jgi:hypothetical protein
MRLLHKNWLDRSDPVDKSLQLPRQSLWALIEASGTASGFLFLLIKSLLSEKDPRRKCQENTLSSSGQTWKQNYFLHCGWQAWLY